MYEMSTESFIRGLQNYTKIWQNFNDNNKVTISRGHGHDLTLNSE